MNKKLGRIILFFLLINTSITNAIDFGTDKISDGLKGGGTNLVTTGTNIITYLLGLVYLIAVVYGIYGGFIILTSGGADDKVKKGKKIIIFVVVGIAVMFLASNLVNWIIALMSSNQIIGTTPN